MKNREQINGLILDVSFKLQIMHTLINDAERQIKALSSCVGFPVWQMAGLANVAFQAGEIGNSVQSIRGLTGGNNE